MTSRENNGFISAKCMIIMLLIVLLSFPVCALAAQEPAGSVTEICDTISLTVYFAHDKGEIDLSIGQNRQLLDSVVRTSGIRHIEIIGRASPEGKSTYNDALSRLRAENTTRWLRERLPDVQIDAKSVGRDWEYMIGIANTSDMVPDEKREVAQIIRTMPDYVVKDGKIVGGRKQSLMLLHSGRTWRYMSGNVFPEMRTAKVTVYYCKQEVTPIVVAETPDTVETLVEEVLPEEPAAGPMRSVVNLKTNLLYDAATVANLALEVGFAKHWSLDLSATFSPWDIRSDIKIRTLLVQPELRYYFKTDFRGSYIGLEGHYGWYNIALPGARTRYQDRDGNTPLYGGGLTYGYVLRFGDHWGMDFSLSVGYANLKYDCFYNVENGARYTTAEKDWWGPTKAGISLYYRF